MPPSLQVAGRLATRAATKSLKILNVTGQSLFFGTRALVRALPVFTWLPIVALAGWMGAPAFAMLTGLDKVPREPESISTVSPVDRATDRAMATNDAPLGTSRHGGFETTPAAPATDAVGGGGSIGSSVVARRERRAALMMERSLERAERLGRQQADRVERAAGSRPEESARTEPHAMHAFNNSFEQRSQMNERAAPVSPGFGLAGLVGGLLGHALGVHVAPHPFGARAGGSYRGGARFSGGGGRRH